MTIGRIGLFCLALLLASCGRETLPPPAPVPPAPAAERLTMTPVALRLLPGWEEDRLADAVPALKRSCDRLTRMPPGQPVGSDGRGGLAGDWNGACGALRWLRADDEAGLRSYLQQWFQAFHVGNGHGDSGRFTGYYEAELLGSRHKSARFRYPLYGKPPAELANLSRAEIEAGALDGKAPVLFWVEDPVDLHILHIQGSGRITLDDGSVAQVGHAGTNGRDFVGLGEILRRHGRLGKGESTMPFIRAWLKSHPAEAPALMAENPRYVFFRVIAGEGPIGAFNVPLTPGRSLAVDTRYIPLGAPLWLDTVDPDGLPLRRLMVAQDTGKAITGMVRGDFFWGFGEAAFDKAGRMTSQGGYYLLLPQLRSGPVAFADPG